MKSIFAVAILVTLSAVSNPPTVWGADIASDVDGTFNPHQS
jgi:hypothetical protein